MGVDGDDPRDKEQDILFYSARDDALHVGPKEATAGEYCILFEWLELMPPQDFLLIRFNICVVLHTSTTVHVDRVLFYYLSLFYTSRFFKK